jgi:hypothetical protein
MPLSTALGQAMSIVSALAGMYSATLRLEASARRIAGAGATRTQTSAGAGGGPAYLLMPVGSAAVAAPAGVRNSAPVWMAAYQDDAGAGEADGLAAGADVDLAAEAFEQATARASYMANAKTLQITQEMVKRLFELDA